MISIRTTLLSAALLALAGLLATATTAGEGTVKVFILAGQSNMEGKARNSLLDYQATDPKTAKLFAHLRDGDKWAVRDDVFIKFLDRKGPLTIGYGSRGCTGVELEFGWTLGDYFDEPVLLIKTAWGGHSLFKQFRPPSSGMPDEEFLQQELQRAEARTRRNNERRHRNDPLPTMEDIKEPYGKSYRAILAEVKDVFEHYETMFPTLRGKRLEIAGFVWLQGWNDMISELGRAEYATNLQHLIKDLRRDLNAPHMPVVIAAMGQNGSKPPSPNMAAIQRAQFAMNDVPEFKGNVKTIATDVLVDKAAERLYPHWRERRDEWEKVGSNFGYHYMGSAIWLNRIGKAVGEAMIELISARRQR